MHSEESEFSDEENFVEDTLFSLYWPSINYPDDIPSIADVLLEETNRMKVTSWDIHAVCNRMGLNLVDCTISLTPEMENMLKPVEKAIPAIDYSKICYFKRRKALPNEPGSSVYHFYLKKLNVMKTCTMKRISPKTRTRLVMIFLHDSTIEEPGPSVYDNYT